MFRNSYDNDTVTYSPTGRLFQVEYANEAIKQGSATVGLSSKTHSVLVALKRNSEDLSSYQKKITRISDHMGLGLAGLAPDARILSNFLRTQAINSKLVFDRPLPLQKAVNALADKAQKNTQSYGQRPYGVGLLIVGYDSAGPHLFEFQPSGSVLEYVGTAIGARSQAARTYLERNFEEFGDCSLEELILHGLKALRDTLGQDKELTTANTSIAFVGKDQKFTALEDDLVGPWLDKLESPAAAAEAEEAAAAEEEETAAPAADATNDETAANDENAMDTQ